MAAVGQDLSGQGQREDRDLDQGNGKPEWKDDEHRLRKDEVRSGWVSVVVQFLVATVALGTVVIALRATNAAREAVDTAREGIERQATEARLSTAISAIGGDQPGERVGGLALLRRHVASQVLAANESGTEQRRLEAHLLYTTALRVLENYLRNPPAGQAHTDGDRGYGTPDVPADNVYAARELQGMMRLKSEVEELGIDALDADASLYPAPSLDLANVELRGQSWTGIDFSWLDGGHFFVGIDLRGANLAGSNWGTSSLRNAFLQCADLNGAQFIGTDLRGADLRGANISGVNFSGATVDETTKLDGVWYDGTRLPTGAPPPDLPPSPPGDWEGRDTCMSDPRSPATNPPAE
jgi:Pentapeptide repeats (8 copies)